MRTMTQRILMSAREDESSTKRVRRAQQTQTFRRTEAIYRPVFGDHHKRLQQRHSQAS